MKENEYLSAITALKNGESNEYTGENATALRYKARQCQSVAAGSSHTVGLRSTSTVVATEGVRSDGAYRGQCEVEDWTDIVAISTGRVHAVGLRADGRLEFSGLPEKNPHDYGQCDVSNWTDNRVPVDTTG